MPESCPFPVTFGAEPQPWTPSHPRELPELRQALVEQIGSPLQHFVSNSPATSAAPDLHAASVIPTRPQLPK